MVSDLPSFSDFQNWLEFLAETALSEVFGRLKMVSMQRITLFKHFLLLITEIWLCAEFHLATLNLREISFKQSRFDFITCSHECTVLTMTLRIWRHVTLILHLRSKLHITILSKIQSSLCWKPFFLLQQVFLNLSH